MPEYTRKIRKSIRMPTFDAYQSNGCCHHDIWEREVNVFQCYACGCILDETYSIREINWKKAIDAEDTSSPEDALLRGVTIGWLLDFTVEHDLWHVPTWVVRRDWVFPATRASRCRFVDLPEMRAFVGRASTYVSHCWGAPFGLIVAALLDGGGDPRRLVWIDLFAVRQWPSSRPDLHLQTVISQCSSFMLVSPFDESLSHLQSKDTLSVNVSKTSLTTIPFFRLWCLTELSIAARIPEMVIILKVGTLVDNDDSKIRTLGVKDVSHMLLSLVHLVDANTANTSLLSDKAFLLQEIQKSEDGIESLHLAVRAKLISSIYRGEGEKTSLVALAAIGDVDPRQQVMTEQDPLIRRQYFFIVAKSGYYKLLMDMLESFYLSDVNTQDDEGNTACMLAAEGGHTLCLQLLIKFGCDVDLKNIYGRSACMLASKVGHASCLQVLLDENCNIDMQDNNGMNACMFAALNDHPNCLKLLLSRHCLVDAFDTHGMTACMHAASENNVECLKLLLQSDISMNMLSYDGWTACMYAADKGSNSCLKLLIESGCDVNAVDEIGMTACMLAAQHGHLDCLETLISSKCDVSCRNAMGRTACMCAVQGNHDLSLRLLLENGCDINAQDHQGMTACVLAAWRGSESCLKLLLEHGCDVDAASKNGKTAFMYAAENGNEGCMELLLKYNCDTQAVDQCGRTAYMIANEAGKESCRKFLHFE